MLVLGGRESAVLGELLVIHVAETGKVFEDGVDDRAAVLLCRQLFQQLRATEPYGSSAWRLRDRWLIPWRSARTPPPGPSGHGPGHSADTPARDGWRAGGRTRQDHSAAGRGRRA